MKPKGEMARKMLMKHAGFNWKKALNESNEEAVKGILEVCNALPLALGIVGETVGRESRGRIDDRENTWRHVYNRIRSKKESIADSDAEEYGGVRLVVDDNFAFDTTGATTAETVVTQQSYFCRTARDGAQLIRERKQAAMLCVLCCNSPATQTLWDTEHLCSSCYQSYLSKQLIVYQARVSAKRKSLRPFPSSLPYEVQAFRRQSELAPFNYQDPRLTRHHATESESSPTHQTSTPTARYPAPEQLLSESLQQTDHPLLFTPPQLQMSAAYSAPSSPQQSLPALSTPTAALLCEAPIVPGPAAQSPVPQNAVVQNEQTLAPEPADEDWFQAHSALKTQYVARMNALRQQNRELRSEVNALKDAIKRLEERMGELKALHAHMGSKLTSE
ncbi:hypothetical protein BWQ96_09286 [Gracilariopsis chorda]|uniref:Uncharacterized protein n=1 Tax=Gracilariopsis chorda TaxID=448386 RepID=A0A2V3IG03_9FLOR|nr:hypothetical protein BWQ96_09286 [Gracilariopsis chorda]|eukprot:PXF40991.1 hypothetical protein BWQ96_09286 [Gracilariopsis chorda]